MAGMELHGGIYYTSEDLAAKLEREEAAEAKRVKAAKELADRATAALGDDALAAAVAAAVAPLIERLDNLDTLVAESIDALGDRISKCENCHTADEKTPEGTEVPPEAGSAADGAASTVSDGAGAPKPAKGAKK